MKNHAKNYLMINILKIVFLNLSLLFLSSRYHVMSQL